MNSKNKKFSEIKYKVSSPESLVKKEYAKHFLGVHPAANLYPLAEGDEFDAICKDIEDNGLLNPLIRDKKTKLLIDGRTRLMACYATTTNIIIEDVDHVDYIKFTMTVNLKRKHWSADQLAIIGDNITQLYEIEAKKNQGGDRKSKNFNEKPNTQKVGELKIRDNESARKVAQEIGVNHDYTSKAATIRKYAPDLKEKVLNGQMGIKDAFKQAQYAKRELKKEEPTEESEKVPLIDIKGKVVAMVDEPKKPKFNTTNDNVDWARFTWNPITGCLHNCDFGCYADDIANKPTFKNIFPVGFKPVFHEHRLACPANTKLAVSDDPRDKRVFVCSMADLFGKWIPDEWIEKVFEACMTNPEWEYLFLTKWTNRYSMLASLPNAWFGASVTKQKEVAQIEKQMQMFQTTGIKWLSVEPMLEHIKFNDLSWCDFVVIGSLTETNHPAPVGKLPAKPVEFEWVFDLVTQCKEFGVPYYLKANLDNGGTIWTKQQPNRRATLALAS